MMLSFLLRPRVLIGLALAAILAGAAWHYASLRSERDHLLVENATLVSSIEALQKAHDETKKAFDAALAAQLAAQERARVLSEQREEVLRAPDSDDGPVAPVLRSALDGLLTDGGED